MTPKIKDQEKWKKEKEDIMDDLIREGKQYIEKIIREFID